MDKTLVYVAFITAVPPTLVALLSLRAVHQVHYLINSRMTELLSASKAESKAEGREIGRKENNGK